LLDKKDEFISDFKVNISSTELRKSLIDNKNIELMINQDVLSYIRENKLYL
jgi:nicotinic acid mononucleotide adenylyltransferase